MRRTLHSFAAALAAMLFVLSIIMCIRSFWADSQLNWVLARDSPSGAGDELIGEHIRLSSSRGKVALTFMRSRSPHTAGSTSAPGPSISRLTWTHFPDDLNDVRKLAKKWQKRYVFEYGRVISREPKKGNFPGAVHQSAYLVIWWPEVMLILGLIAWPLVRRELSVRSRPWRLLHGYCVECGYDLRKSIGACPECGKGRWGLE